MCPGCVLNFRNYRPTPSRGGDPSSNADGECGAAPERHPKTKDELT
ncbi:hypothetical protein [Devosia sp. DBB001]|nr:hypothetical protein [Devosia sp. DBB001]